MIYILAGTYSHAKKWAHAQQLTDDEWFSTLDIEDLNSRENFHVVILESASELPPAFFEKIYRVAHKNGRMGR